ncbi:MAG: hypothetical protein KDC69_08105 [Flavobacteriaceae bacterium]|nr:hypothetical protein [Flavobacteriaceae bacterium]
MNPFKKLIEAFVKLMITKAWDSEELFKVINKMEKTDNKKSKKKRKKK